MKPREKRRASKKHHHPLNQDNAVVDWSFASDWLIHSADNYKLNLKISIDFIYADFCSQLSNYANETKDIANIIEHNKTLKGLEKQIVELENAIVSEKQFNNKVALNIQLNQAKEQLRNFNKS